MSVKVFKQEVELSFDNSVEDGVINISTSGCTEGIIELFTSVGYVWSEHANTQSVNVDKKDFIKFLKSSLELLEGEG